MSERLTFGPQQQQHINIKNKENEIAEQLCRNNGGLQKCLKDYEQKCQTSQIKKKYQGVLEEKNKQISKKINIGDKQNEKQFTKIQTDLHLKLSDAFTQNSMNVISQKPFKKPLLNSPFIPNSNISPFQIRSKEQIQNLSKQKENNSLVDKKSSFGQIDTTNSQNQIGNTFAQQNLFQDKIQSRIQKIERLNNRINQIMDEKNRSPFSKTQIIRQTKSIISQHTQQHNAIQQQKLATTFNYANQLKKQLPIKNIYQNLNYCDEKIDNRIDAKAYQRSNYQIKAESSKDRSESLIKLGSQINRITDRIRRSEQNKRKLKIDYKPFSYQKHKSKNVVKTDFDYQRCQKIKETQILLNDFQIKMSKRVKIKENENLVTNNKVKMHQRQFNLINKQIHTHDQPTFLKKNKEKHIANIQRNINQIQQPMNDDQFSFYHRKIQNNSQNKIKEEEYSLRGYPDLAQKYFSQEYSELEKLICAFKRQIKLDEELRLAKTWFTHCKFDSKFQHLEKVIIRKDYEMMYPDLFRQSLPQIFNAFPEQQNPYFSNLQQVYRDLDKFYLKSTDMLENYIAAQTNWIANIENQMKSDELISQGFNKRMLHIQNTGKICLEDLVKFINSMTGISYRNKDLFLIYRRLLRYVKGIEVQKQLLNRYRNGMKENYCLLFQEMLDCLCSKDS